MLIVGDGDLCPNLGGELGPLSSSDEEEFGSCPPLGWCLRRSLSFPSRLAELSKTGSNAPSTLPDLSLLFPLDILLIVLSC